jgi:hypothetical protein
MRLDAAISSSSAIDSLRISRFCLLIRRGLVSSSGMRRIVSNPGTTKRGPIKS